MLRIPTKFRKLVLVCTNSREDGKCCADGGSESIRDALKVKIKALGLPVRVSKSCCLDMCQTGPTVVIMPDDIWLSEVSMADIDGIVALLQAGLSR